MPDALDVFVSTKADRPIRRSFAAATLKWWAQEAHRGRVRLHVFDLGASPELWRELMDDDLMPAVVEPMPLAGSQRARHAWAAARATTDVYVVSDDDLIPMRSTHRRFEGVPARWDLYVRDVMARYPRWGLASALVTPGLPDPYVTAAALRRAGVDGELAPEDVARIARALRLPGHDDERWPVGNCGGVRVMRRGAVFADEAALPPIDPEAGGGYDGRLCGYLKDRGYEVGFLTRWRAIHAGAEESEWAGGRWGGADE